MATALPVSADKLTTLPSSLERVVLCAHIASDHKARDILVLDMRGLTPLFDYMLIATAAGKRQMHAIAEEIDAKLTQLGDQRLGQEGYEGCKWIVQDFGDVVIHLFDPLSRDYYALESLWADAPRVPWERM
jgi:ribosome-associated protein